MLRRSDFDASFLQTTGHRPWPLPAGPWIMTQSWHDLLFAHWPVDPALLREKVPPQFPLDLFDGVSWIGVLPFHMTNVAPRGIPSLPWLSAFPELNVRTYVTLEEKPGVYFFSLDAGQPIAVAAARALFSLPYYSAFMKVALSGGWVEYSSRRTSDDSATFVGRYRPTGPIYEAVPGTLDYFLTERYCLYTLDSHSRPYRLEIHHRPWPLQPAELEISANTVAHAAGIPLPAAEPVLHFSKRQDMVAWPLRRF